MTKKNLLPVGFYDLIFEEAEKSYVTSSLAANYLIESGYRLIKPTLIEFDNDYQSNKESEFFVTTDGISGRKIAIRCDITLQVRRIFATRLKSQKLPLKLCYIGDVIKAKSEDLYSDRQQTQIGFEIIGVKDYKSDLLVISNLIEILKKIKLKQFTFNFSLPNLLDIMLSELKIRDKKSLKRAILQKDLSKVSQISVKYSDILQKIVRFNSDLPKIIADIKQTTASPAIEAELDRVKKIHQFFNKNYPNIQLNFDLFASQQDDYHKDIYFEVFAAQFPYPIARGGRYNIDDNCDEITSVGATIYVNNLRKI